MSGKRAEPEAEIQRQGQRPREMGKLCCKLNKLSKIWVSLAMFVCSRIYFWLPLFSGKQRFGERLSSGISLCRFCGFHSDSCFYDLTLVLKLEIQFVIKKTRQVEAQWNAQLLGLDPRLIFLWTFLLRNFPFCGFSWLAKSFTVKLFKYKLFFHPQPAPPYFSVPFWPCVASGQERRWVPSESFSICLCIQRRDEWIIALELWGPDYESESESESRSNPSKGKPF